MQKWPVDGPNIFVSFSSFWSLLKTFRCHNFEADLKSSVVLRVARDILIATMIRSWNQHTRSQELLQNNLTHFVDWIGSYAEACEDISRNGTRELDWNFLLEEGQPNCHFNSALKTKTSVNVPHTMSVYDRQDCMKMFNICPKFVWADKKNLCQSKTRFLGDRCNGFHHSILHKTDARQQQQKAQPSGTGIKSHKTLTRESKQTKTRPSMDVI